MIKINKMKSILLFTLAMLISEFAYSQNYKTAIGFKGGFPGFVALNIKHSLGSTTAIEASIGGGRNFLWLEGLFEINKDMGSGFNWYYGIGGDIGTWNNNYNFKYRESYYNGAYGGVDGVIGIEYTFNEIPFNIAVDATPTVRLFPYVGFGIYGNIALRFAIK
jgi:hypothetical protein